MRLAGGYLLAPAPCCRLVSLLCLRFDNCVLRFRFGSCCDKADEISQLIWWIARHVSSCGRAVGSAVFLLWGLAGSLITLMTGLPVTSSISDEKSGSVFVLAFANEISRFVFDRWTSMVTFTLSFHGHHGIVPCIFSACALSLLRSVVQNISSWSNFVGAAFWISRSSHVFVFGEELANGTCAAVRFECNSLMVVVSWSNVVSCRCKAFRYACGRLPAGALLLLFCYSPGAFCATVYTASGSCVLMCVVCIHAGGGFLFFHCLDFSKRRRALTVSLGLSCGRPELRFANQTCCFPVYCSLAVPAVRLCVCVCACVRPCVRACVCCVQWCVCFVLFVNWLPRPFFQGGYIFHEFAADVCWVLMP